MNPITRIVHWNISTGQKVLSKWTIDDSTDNKKRFRYFIIVQSKNALLLLSDAVVNYNRKKWNKIMGSSIRD